MQLETVDSSLLATVNLVSNELVHLYLHLAMDLALLRFTRGGLRTECGGIF